MDFFEYRGKHVLLMVDAFSKKIWTAVMNTDTTTNQTLAVLYGWFCSEVGTPTTLVSDNGPQFTAKEFGEYFHHLIIPVATVPQNALYNFAKID